MANVNLRINRKLKDDFKKVCEDKGLSISKTVKLFTLHYLKNSVLPFPLANKSMYEHSDIKITLWLEDDTRDILKHISLAYGISIASIIKLFMEYCITHNYFPEICLSSNSIEANLLLKKDIERLLVTCDSYEKLQRNLIDLGYKIDEKENMIVFTTIEGITIYDKDLGENYSKINIINKLQKY